MVVVQKHLGIPSLTHFQHLDELSASCGRPHPRGHFLCLWCTIGGGKEEQGVTSAVEVLAVSWDSLQSPGTPSTKDNKEESALLDPGTQSPENSDISCDQGG